MARLRARARALPTPAQGAGDRAYRRRRRLGACPAGRLWVEAPDEPIGGRIDRVEHTAAGVEIVDMKSGWTVSDELRPAHRRQLLIYAYLWHSRHGEWPVAASIQLLDGTRITFEVDSEEAIAAASDALALLRGYNARVESRGDRGGAFAAWRRDMPPLRLQGRVLALLRGLVTRLELVPEGASRRGRRGLTAITSSLWSRSLSAAATSLRAPIKGARHSVPAQLGALAGTAVAAVDLLPAQAPTDVRYAWDATMRAAAKRRLPEVA